MIAARAAGDLDTAIALLASSREADDQSICIYGVLSVAAATVAQAMKDGRWPPADMKPTAPRKRNEGQGMGK